MKFSAGTLDILYHSTWTEEREGEVTEWERMLHRAGLPPLPEVIREFMQRFAYLEIVSDSGNAVIKIVFVDPNRPDWSETLEYVQDRIGQSVFPIGYGRQDAYLCMSHEGVLYSNYDDYIVSFKGYGIFALYGYLFGDCCVL